jgi:hypothetical protein
MLDAKESAGIGRAQLANVFASDGFQDGQLVLVSSLVAAREAHLDRFLSLAPESVVSDFEEQASPRASRPPRCRRSAARPPRSPPPLPSWTR